MFGKQKSVMLEDAARLEQYIAAYMKATSGKIPSDDLIAKFLQGEVKIPVIQKKPSNFARFMRWYLSVDSDLTMFSIFIGFISFIIGFGITASSFDKGEANLIFSRLQYILYVDIVILTLFTVLKAVIFTYVVKDTNAEFKKDE